MHAQTYVVGVGMLHDEVEQAAHQQSEETDYLASQSDPNGSRIRRAGSVNLEPQPNRH